jgi:hypothetical protein
VVDGFVSASRKSLPPVLEKVFADDGGGTKMKAVSIIEAAEAYIQRGWSPIPIPAQKKAPNLRAWQNLRLDAKDVRRHFNGGEQNIGVLLGEPSGWLVDVDLDHPLAVAQAENFLPATLAIFGRSGKPRSHWLYRVTSSVETIKGKGPCGMIVELRSTGCQTVFPPSVHPTGEAIEWFSDGEPLEIKPDELLQCVKDLTDEVLRRIGKSEAPATKRRAPAPAPIEWSQSDLIERCWRYVQQKPDAISGQRGHDATFSAACECYKFGLTDAGALQVMRRFNEAKTGGERWSEKELAHKLADARNHVITNQELGSWLEPVDNPVPTRAPSRAFSPSPVAEQAPAELAPPAFTRLLSSAEFLKLDLRPKFIVKNCLVAGQPAVIGGRSKTMKTSIATDLVVSLGSGTPFLGEFPSEKVTVAFWCGESGAATIRETAKRIAESKGVRLEDCSILWNFDLPKLYDLDHLDAIRATIQSRGIEVALIDPLYLSLLSPATAGYAGNLFAMGSFLAPLSAICHETGVTLVVLHHFRKGGQPDPNEPAGLEELSQSGICEWARQWILLQRRSTYQSDGRHELWLRTGGSTGHGALSAVNVDEGILDPETFTGRRWEVTIQSVTDAREENKRAEEQRKIRAAMQRDEEDRRNLLAAVRKLPKGETKRVLRDLVGLRDGRLERALSALVGEGRVEPCEVTKNNRAESGYRPTGK